MALFSLIIALLPFLLPTAVDSAVGYNPIIQCVELDGSTTTVCFTSSFETPSPGSILLENGTEVTEYVGPYGFTYEFWKKAYEGTNIDEWLSSQDRSAFRTNPGSVSVRWYPDEDACELDVGSIRCTDCTVCNNGAVQISADCTAAPMGRMLSCEAVEPVLFPITPLADGDDVTPATDTSHSFPTRVAYFAVAAMLVVSLTHV